jgi:uncharacterized protein
VSISTQPIPANAGVGLKPQHYQTILADTPDIGWFEVHPENYFCAGGASHQYLTAINEQYPLSMHGVGMSLGSCDGLDMAHLKSIKQLLDRYQPALFSEHLSWSRFQGQYTNDLLPVIYSQEMLKQFISNIKQAQDYLERPLLIENPSSYFQVALDFSEAEFLVELVTASDAFILLDINNIYVSANNHGFDAKAYIDQIPAHLVKEYHLAGHSIDSLSEGKLHIDDHGSEVCQAVWQLYEYALNKIGTRPTLIEWDTNIPSFEYLLLEAQKANQRITQHSPNKVLADA